MYLRLATVHQWERHWHNARLKFHLSGLASRLVTRETADVHRCWRLCGAKAWRFDRPFRTMPEWWRVHIETQWFLYLSGGVPDGFKTASWEQRWKTHPLSPWLTADPEQRIAGARHCRQGCNTFLHLCSNRSLCCLVCSPRNASFCGFWARACAGRAQLAGTINHKATLEPNTRDPPKQS